MSRRQPLTNVVLLLFVGGAVLYPLWGLIEAGLRGTGGRTLDHFARVLDLTDPAAREAIVNSVLVSIFSVVGSGIIGFGFAFVLTQFRFPFRRLLAGLSVLPIALPPLVGVIAFLFAFGESGILPRVLGAATGIAAQRFALDGIPAIIATHIYSFSVYFTLLLSAAFRRMDGAALEAALVLGSGVWGTFRRVMLPQLRFPLLGAGVLTFMASMASFSAPLLFAGAHRFLPLEIYTAKLNGDWERAAATSIVLALISILFYILFSRLPGEDRGPRAGKGAARSVPLPVPPFARRWMIGGLIVIEAIALLPLLIVVLVSFAEEGSWTWQILPSGYTWENYSVLFRDPTLLHPFLNSGVMALFAAAGALVVGLSGAIRVTATGKGHGSVVDTLVTLPHAIPGTVIALSLILSFPSFVGSFWILPFAYFIRTSPLLHRSAASALRQVERSVVEAAETLGAGPLRRWRTVVIPLILPGLVAGVLLVVIAALGEFVSSVLLYTYSSRPVSIEILASLRNLQFGVAAALSTLLLFLIILLVWLSGRFSEGMDTPVR